MTFEPAQTPGFRRRPMRRFQAQPIGRTGVFAAVSAPRPRVVNVMGPTPMRSMSLAGCPSTLEWNPFKSAAKAVKKVAKVVGKVAKIAIPVAAAAFVAPAAAGLVLRGAGGAIKLAKAGFRFGRGTPNQAAVPTTPNNPSPAPTAGTSPATPATPGPPFLPTAQIPNGWSSDAYAAAQNAAYQNTGNPATFTVPSAPQSADRSQDVAQAAGVSGVNPALIAGAVVVGGALLLAAGHQRGRRGRA